MPKPFERNRARRKAIFYRARKAKREKDMIDYEAETGSAPDNTQLKLISELVAQQLDIEAAIAALDASLKEQNRRLRKVQESDLPQAMLAAGCKAYTTADGHSVTIKEDISASLAEGKKGPAIAWLRENGHGDLVSEEVYVAFGRGQEEEADQVASLIAQEGYTPTRRTNVNTATLKSLIRELRANGTDVPLETLGAYEWQKAIIK